MASVFFNMELACVSNMDDCGGRTAAATHDMGAYYNESAQIAAWLLAVVTLFGAWGLGFGVWGLGFGVWGLGFGAWYGLRGWELSEALA